MHGFASFFPSLPFFLLILVAGDKTGLDWTRDIATGDRVRLSLFVSLSCLHLFCVSFRKDTLDYLLFLFGARFLRYLDCWARWACAFTTSALQGVKGVAACFLLVAPFHFPGTRLSGQSPSARRPVQPTTLPIPCHPQKATMATTSTLPSTSLLLDLIAIWLLQHYLLTFLTGVLVGYVVWQKWCAPLAGVPGHFWAGLSKGWLIWRAWRGDVNRVLMRLHERHGPLVRIGPNEV